MKKMIKRISKLLIFPAAAVLLWGGSQFAGYLIGGTNADAVPGHVVPPRTEAKPAAKAVDDMRADAAPSSPASAAHPAFLFDGPPAPADAGHHGAHEREPAASGQLMADLDLPAWLPPGTTLRTPLRDFLDPDQEQFPGHHGGLPPLMTVASGPPGGRHNAVRPDIGGGFAPSGGPGGEGPPSSLPYLYPDGNPNPDGGKEPHAPAPVPEPSTIVLLGIGLAGIAAMMSRRRREHGV